MSWPARVTSIVCSTLWYRASLFPMHSSASRAANGMSSAKRACEDPNRSFISEARNDPRASAASAGNVIMHRACLLHNNHGLVVMGEVYRKTSSRFDLVPPQSSGSQRCRQRLASRGFVGGNLDDKRLLEFAHRIELGTASVVDVPTVGVQRHRNAAADVPNAMDVLWIAERDVASGHHSLAAALQISVPGLSAIIEPVPVDFLFTAFHPNHDGPGLMVMRGRTPVGQP